MLSDQLAEAMKVPIAVGQYVVVRSAGGDRMVEGYVEDVDAERGIVRVRDTDQGSDATYFVDTSRYVLWVEPPKDWAPGQVPQNLFVRPSAPGPYGRQWATSVGT